MMALISYDRVWREQFLGGKHNCVFNLRWRSAVCGISCKDTKNTCRDNCLVNHFTCVTDHWEIQDSHLQMSVRGFPNELHSPFVQVKFWTCSMKPSSQITSTVESSWLTCCPPLSLPLGITGGFPHVVSSMAGTTRKNRVWRVESYFIYKLYFSTKFWKVPVMIRTYEWYNLAKQSKQSES